MLPLFPTCQSAGKPDALQTLRAFLGRLENVTVTVKTNTIPAVGVQVIFMKWIGHKERKKTQKAERADVFSRRQ